MTASDRSILFWQAVSLAAPSPWRGTHPGNAVPCDLSCSDRAADQGETRGSHPHLGQVWGRERRGVDRTVRIKRRSPRYGEIEDVRRPEPGEAVHVGVLRVRHRRSRGAYQSRCPYRSARL